MQDFSQAISFLFIEHHAAWLGYAARTFPGLDASQREDALQQALLEALSGASVAPIWARRRSDDAGLVELKRVFYKIFWRKLYAEHGRRDRAHLTATGVVPGVGDAPDAEARAVALQALGADGEDAARARVYLVLCRPDDPALRPRVDALVERVAGSKPWVRGALSAWIDSGGTESKTNLGARFGAHLSQARSVISRKITRLEATIGADPVLRTQLSF